MKLNFFPFWFLYFRRSIREGFPNVWRSQTKEKEDIDKKEHFESSLQRGYCLWCPYRKYRTDQPFDCSDGLWPVRSFYKALYKSYTVFWTFFAWVIFNLLLLAEGHKGWNNLKLIVMTKLGLCFCHINSLTCQFVSSFLFYTQDVMQHYVWNAGVVITLFFSLPPAPTV